MGKIVYYAMPILKVLLFIVFIIICAIPFALLSQLGFMEMGAINPLISDILSEAAVAIVILSALLMVFKVYSRYNFSNIFIVRKHVITGFSKGTLIGFAILITCSGLALLNGNVLFTIGKISLLSLLGYVILYILVGVFEEFMFRSFPLFVFSERYPMVLAILITSLFFGLAHIENDGFNWLAMLNITLAGILFAILVLLKRNIYWAVGIHFGWNFTQGVILGYNVSGTEAAGFLNAKPIGPTYFSGGNFGIEGSVFCTGVLLASIIYLLIRKKIEPIHEVLVDEEEIHEFN